ncbi:MAG: hypothetical protein ABJE66_08525, partial [Deltaproteobacteria bacterium]
MSKKKSDASGESAEAASKKAKKPAPPKKAAPAKKAEKPASKPAAKKPRAKKDSQVEVVGPEAIEVLGEGEALNDVIEAELVAETPAEPPVPLTEEEQQLSAIYGEEVTGGSPTAHSEFSDHKTRDEDRPMMPEINAREERKAQWQDRRDRRKQRRDERQQRRDDRGGQQGQGQQGHVPQGQQGGSQAGSHGGGRPHEQQRMFHNNQGQGQG